MYHKFVKENVLKKIKQCIFRSRYEHNNKGEYIVRWRLILSFQTLNTMYFISLTTHIILVCNVILNPTIYKCYMACRINTRSQQKKTFRQKPHQSDTARSLYDCSVRVKTLRRPPPPFNMGCNNTSKLESGP